VRKRGIRNLSRRSSIFLGGPRLPLALGSAPGGIDADDGCYRGAVSLAVGSGSGSIRGREVAATGIRILEEKVEPD